MHVGGPAAAGRAQSLIRFNPDVSVDTVLTADQQTVLSDVATSIADGVILSGDDGVPFIERVCLE